MYNFLQVSVISASMASRSESPVVSKTVILGVAMLHKFADVSMSSVLLSLLGSLQQKVDLLAVSCLLSVVNGSGLVSAVGAAGLRCQPALVCHHHTGLRPIRSSKCPART